MKTKEKVGLLQVFDLMKAGVSPAKISKDYNIPKQNVSYFVGKLKKLGCVEKKGYGVWGIKRDLKEVKKVPKGSIAPQSFTSKKKQIRGHAFIWKIEFFDEILWKKFIERSNLTNQLICNKRVFRILFKNRKVWLTKKGMVIYEPMDFMGRSSFEVKGTAVFEMDLLIKDLLRKLKIKFRPYRFTTSREHYAMIKNQLAKQYNDKKEKLFVYNEEGGVWLWVDHSHGIHELETNDAITSRKIQGWYNSHKKTNFDVTPEFVLKGFKELSQGIKKNADHLGYHAENLRSHVKAVKTLGDNVDVQNRLFERIANVLEKLEKK